MKISIDLSSKNEVSVALNGEFDAAGCKAVRDELEKSVELCNQNTFYLDLKDVSFIDSSGIGAIVFLYKRVNASNGKLKVVNVGGQPKELMNLLRVPEAIPVSWVEPAA